MVFCWIKCLAVNVFFMQLNVAVSYTRRWGGTRENWCACSHLHINLLITPTLIITLTHLHALKFVPFRCFCYSCARLFIIASLERSSVYPSILQTWLKSFFKWKEIAIKGRVIVTWYLQRRGSFSAGCSEALTEKKSQSKEECQSIFTD